MCTGTFRTSGSHGSFGRLKNKQPRALNTKCRHKIRHPIWSLGARLCSVSPDDSQPIQNTDPIRYETNRFASCVNQTNSCSAAKLSLPAVSCSWQQVQRLKPQAPIRNPQTPNPQSRASWPGSYKNGIWRACSVSCRFETETRVCAAIEFDRVFGFQIGFLRRFGQVLNHL